MRSSWLVTFADLSAILVAFFVLYVSMTTVGAEKSDVLAQLFGRDEGTWQSVRPLDGPEAVAVSRADSSALETEHYLATVIRARAADAGWPLVVRSVEGAVLIGGLDPARRDPGFAGYLDRLGLGMAIVARVPQDSGGDGFGPHESALRLGSTLAMALKSGGVSGNLPVNSRVDPRIDAPRVELRITLPQAVTP
ncbi:MAG: flagellar motor protein MotB [Pseudomonadota bacterium]|nr:flagellar motor protein MotB [Pseudomonadota bacterium]